MAHWPQYLTLAWLLISSVISSHKSAGRYSLGVNLFGEVVSTAIIVFVLYAGGFWAPLGFTP